MNIDQQFLLQTLTDLVRIDSSNPSLTPGSAGEAGIGEYIARTMRALGLQVRTHELAPRRVNVVGVLGGSGGGRSLMLNAHMDTVGVAGMAEPFSAHVRNGKLYGRGSQDMKASIAAMLAAARAIQDAGTKLNGDLILACVADEEHASIGTIDLVKHYRADAAIVTEPTELAVSLAHRGFIWFEVQTVGRAAHGSRYQEGIDAIMHMGRFLSALDHLEKSLRQRSPHPLAGPPSLHASTIKGGTELSIYPSECTLAIERRTVPGENVELATAELKEIIEVLKSQDAQFQASIKTGMSRSPFEIDASADIVQVLDRVITGRLGKAPIHSGAAFWTDAAILAEAGIPSVLFGPSGAGLHSAEEWVEIQSAVDMAAVLALAAEEFCR